MRRILAAGALALVSALLLSGCIAPEATPDPQPTRTPKPTATADAAPPTAPTQPTSEVSTVAQIVIRTHGLELRDSTGTLLDDLPYDDDEARALEVITSVLGPPTTETGEASLHFPAYALHDWDGAFTVVMPEFDEHRLGVTGHDRLGVPAFQVLAAATEVRGIALVTADGAKVGMSLADVPGVRGSEWTCSGWAVEVLDGSTSDRGTPRFGVSLGVEGGNGLGDTAPQGIIQNISAPEAVSAGCV